MVRFLTNNQIKILWSLQLLFFIRVIAQLQALIISPPWLPAFEHWQSGLVPYYLLLPIQIIILMVMTIASYNAATCRGVFYVTSPKAKKVLTIIAALYAFSMVIRFIVRSILYPDAAWFEKGNIPTFFHFILASYIYMTTLSGSDNK